MTAIAIDGPAGAGKSTVAKAVAASLGWDYIDSGALYRAVALAALEAGLSLDDGAAVAGLARRTRIEGPATFIDSVDVTDRIRTPEVTRAAAIVARHPAVRAALLPQQRDLAARHDVVMEGRDIGTQILPDAEIKVFLTASLAERARRRAHDLGRSDLDEVMKDIEARDRSDETRAAAPLVRAVDATVIDTTGKSIDEVVVEITALVGKVVR